MSITKSGSPLLLVKDPPDTGGRMLPLCTAILYKVLKRIDFMTTIEGQAAEANTKGSGISLQLKLKIA